MNLCTRLFWTRLFRPEAARRDLAAEIESHLAMAAADNPGGTVSRWIRVRISRPAAESSTTVRATSLLTSLLFGALPAFQTRRVDLRSSAFGGSHAVTARSNRIRLVLIAGRRGRQCRQAPR